MQVNGTLEVASGCQQSDALRERMHAPSLAAVVHCVHVGCGANASKCVHMCKNVKLFGEAVV